MGLGEGSGAWLGFGQMNVKSQALSRCALAL